MGFLRRLVGGLRRSGRGERGPITTWPAADSFRRTFDGCLFDPVGEATVEVVGASHYQGTLGRIAGGRTVDGARNRDHMAALLPEPSNPDDTTAVRVYLGPPWKKAGYLSRMDAVRYRPVIDRLAAMGKVTACRASLSGGLNSGSRNRRSFGITLHLDPPPSLMAEIDRAYGPDPRRPSPGGA